MINCCNPFKSLIDYIDDMKLQPSMLERVYELSNAWESLNQRVTELEKDTPSGIGEELAELKSQVETLSAQLAGKVDTSFFTVFQANVNASIETMETDIAGLKRKTNSLESNLNTVSHLVEQAQDTANDALQGLDLKANNSGDNLTTEEATAFATKLGVDSKLDTSEFNTFKALNEVNKADSNASNLSLADIQAWQEKLGGEGSWEFVQNMFFNTTTRTNTITLEDGYEYKILGNMLFYGGTISNSNNRIDMNKEAWLQTREFIFTTTYSGSENYRDHNVAFAKILNGEYITNTSGVNDWALFEVELYQVPFSTSQWVHKTKTFSKKGMYEQVTIVIVTNNSIVLTLKDGAEWASKFKVYKRKRP